MTEQTRSLLQQSSGRLIFLSLVFIFCFASIGYRLFDLTVVGVKKNDFDETTQSVTQGSALRADIIDRNGVLLATSLKSASLYADPKLIDNPLKVAQGISSILPQLDRENILGKLKSSKRFVWLARNLTPKQHYQVNALGFPGLKFRFEDRRMYPQGRTAAHVIGYTDVDGKGLAGIERTFDHALKDDNKPVQLTLDVRVQHILQRELKSAMKKFSAKAAIGLVMESQSGDIVAISSLPGFDPHHPGDFEGDKKFNRATLGVYEMGSTFKLFSTAAALEYGTATFGTKFDARKPLKIGRFTIRDYHPEKRHLTLVETLIHSSNIGSALIAEDLGTDRLKSFYQNLGFMSAPDLEIGETGQPLVPSPWREVNTLTASFGHGIAVSPVQLAVAAAAMVNGGLLPRPSLIYQKEKDQATYETRIISPQTSYKMRQLMQLAVMAGTGSKAAVEGYDVGGKTGTAEKPVNGTYSREALLASFLGAFPMNDPQYIVLVILDEPQGTEDTYGYATGGWTAAPVVANVIRDMAPLLGVEPVATEDRIDVRSVLQRYITKGKSLASY